MLVGHVTWQGMADQPSAQQQMPITLTLKSGPTQVNYPIQVTNASGFFTVTVASLPASSYTWRVKGPAYLANSGNVNLSGSPSTNAEMGLMRAGDTNNDNVVEVSNFNLLKGNFGQAGAPPLLSQGP